MKIINSIGNFVRDTATTTIKTGHFDHEGWFVDTSWDGRGRSGRIEGPFKARRVSEGSMSTLDVWEIEGGDDVTLYFE